MNYFFSKLIPPRPTFPGDMTPEEAKFMQEHANYWRELVAKDRAVVLGPVMDPAGAFGVGIIRATDAAQARAMVEEDPVIKAQLGFQVDVHPMPSVLLKT